MSAGFIAMKSETEGYSRKQQPMPSNVPASGKLPVAVIGVGHMGRHHARIYSQMEGIDLVAVVDTNLDRARELADRFGTEALDDFSSLLGKIAASSVAVPTTEHLSVSKPLIEAGIAVLIEKPLAGSVDQARRILELAQRNNCVLQVGHTERFNPVVRAMKRLDVQPRFIETHRISPFTFRSADIGVVMDMMIHDIDIVLSLTGSPVVKADAVGVNVLGPNEDIANARLQFANGCVANLTASRLALKTERKIRVFSEQAYLSLDYQKKSGIAIKKDANLDVLQLARQRRAEDLADLAGLNYSDMVKVEPLQVDDEEPLRVQLESFIHAVRHNTEPEVPAEDGFAAVQTADMILQSLRRHQWSVQTP